MGLQSFFVIVSLQCVVDVGWARLCVVEACVSLSPPWHCLAAARSSPEAVIIFGKF